MDDVKEEEAKRTYNTIDTLFRLARYDDVRGDTNIVEKHLNDEASTLMPTTCGLDERICFLFQTEIDPSRYPFWLIPAGIASIDVDDDDHNDEVGQNKKVLWVSSEIPSDEFTAEYARLASMAGSDGEIIRREVQQRIGRTRRNLIVDKTLTDTDRIILLLNVDGIIKAANRFVVDIDDGVPIEEMYWVLVPASVLSRVSKGGDE